MNLLTGDGRWWGLRALLRRPVLPKLIGENGRTMAGGSLKRIREKEERGGKKEGGGRLHRERWETNIFWGKISECASEPGARQRLAQRFWGEL